MKVAIINSAGFWAMGWATDPASQRDVVRSLARAGIEVTVDEVASKAELLALLQRLKRSPCLVWPNAYRVAVTEGSAETLWLGDIIDQHGLPMIGSNAKVLRNVMLKDQCQQLLEQAGVAIPHFLAVEPRHLSGLAAQLAQRDMTFPLFVKPNALSTSKGITQDSVVHTLAQLTEQVMLSGERYGYPVMVEEYLPGQDITVAVFMTPQLPVILATYYDTEIYDDPGAVLDYEVRQRDWNDGKWLRVVEEPEVLAQLEAVVLPACEAVGVDEFTRIDCRMDQHGQIKAFDVNGLPGLELPFSTTVWQMIVKMADSDQEHAFDTLISLILYSAAYRHQVAAPARIAQLAEAYIAANRTISVAQAHLAAHSLVADASHAL